MKALGYLFDRHYLLHDTGSRHVESARRLEAIAEALAGFDAGSRWQRAEARPAHRDELELVHLPEHIDRVERASRRAPSYLDADTVVSSESYRTALLAAGGVLECVDALCAGRLRRAIAFVRPPGHHAEPQRAMGFCLFNNVAIAAAYAIARHHLERVAVVDNDVHHGNGTQAAFYSRPDVLYISSHQFPFYPGSGNFHETGRGEGKGYTINFPLPAGAADSTFVPLYSRIVRPVLEQYRPQLILVSLGFDAHYKDPLGGLKVTEAGYASSSASLMRAAEEYCDGKICFVLEGGYSMEALQECTRAVMAEMEKDSPREMKLAPDELFTRIAQSVKENTGGLWKW